MRMIPRFRHIQLRSSQLQRMDTVQILENFLTLPHALQILFVLVKLKCCRHLGREFVRSRSACENPGIGFRCGIICTPAP